MEYYNMSSHQNQDVLQRVVEEGFNKGNYNVLDTLYVPDYKEHQFGSTNTLEGFKGYINLLRTAFPDLHVTIEDMVAEGDKVWVRMTTHGTNNGPFMGPPTGKSITITVIDIFRFENGMIVEHWGVPDRFAGIVQLGLFPQVSRQKS